MPFQFQIIQPPPHVSLLGAIGGLGLTTNLKLVLDAGDALSYTSGQSWLDRSGNGYDFFRGTTVASQASDPTFNGTAGRQSKNEYWSFDGGDFFTYDTTNEAWMQTLHKNNSKFSIAAWVYFATASSEAWHLFSTTDSTGAGIYVQLNATDDFEIVVLNAGLSIVYSGGAAAMGHTAGWNFVGVALDEAANVIRVVRNATQKTSTCTFASPDAGNAQITMVLGSNGSAPQNSGTRIANLAMWQGTALTAANFTSLFNDTRSIFEV